MIARARPVSPRRMRARWWDVLTSIQRSRRLTIQYSGTPLSAYTWSLALRSLSSDESATSMTRYAWLGCAVT